MTTETRETAEKIYEAHDGADCEFCGALCPDDAAALIDAIDKALSDERQRMIDLFGNMLLEFKSANIRRVDLMQKFQSAIRNDSEGD